MFIIMFLALATSSPAVEQQNYNEITEHFQEVRLLKALSWLTYWDQETYMPKEGIDLRAKQLSYLSGKIQEKETDPIFGEKLAKLIDLQTGEILVSDLNSIQDAALKQWRKDYLKTQKFDVEFIKMLAALTSKSLPIWLEAKKSQDFTIFAPQLEKLVDTMRKRAEILGYEKHPYDALLDEYESGMTTEKVDALFSTIKQPLIDLVRKNQSQNLSSEIFHGDFDAGKQLAFCEEILTTMGLNMDRAHIDRSHHPFTLGIHPQDVRLTISNNPIDMRGVLSSTIHEGGHSLYEQGLPLEHFDTPICMAISMGIHESQSRFWQTCIGLSKPFWEYFYPRLQTNFPDHFQDISFEEFYATMTQVFPSLIRVKADELTYTLHIILRYEIEKELIEGSLAVQDIPTRWLAKMQEYLGVEPEHDGEGCLQDVHWAQGYFGYFPTYALGNMYAAQFFHSFAKEHSDWEERVRKGDMHFIRDYLNENVHKHGNLYTAEETIERVTGEKLNPQYYIDYLKKKYEKI